MLISDWSSDVCSSDLIRACGYSSLRRMRPAAESDLRSESGNRQPQPGEHVGEMRQRLRCRSGIGARCRLVADEAHVRLAFGQAVEAEPEEIAQRVHERDRLCQARTSVG